MINRILLIILSFSNFTFTYSQQTFDFGFERDNSIIVKDSIGQNLDLAWAGGLNAAHFQKIDLNGDGIRDLITFDTHGDRLMTYINNGVANTINYTYEPKYQNKFPKCFSWLQTYDYDNDGKMDLFTYYPGGISVYRNISTGANLQFELITKMIYYNAEGGSQPNLYVSSADFPSFTDVDFDGDMDILTFHVLGTYILWYKNYSMEEYGIPDSLNFKIADKCWGKFAEGENNNAVSLNQYCNYKYDDNVNKIAPPPDLKHTGSTLLSLDLNADSIMDLLLGDVDYFTINSLINGGTRDSAHIVYQDTTFPYVYPIDIVTFPSMNYIDINNDSIKDLIVSPFDPSYYKVNGSDGTWLYTNNGLNNQPNFQLSKKGFLQKDMIDVGDGALPAIADVDGDGLMDLLVGNYGDVDSTYLDSIWYILQVYKISRISYFRNIGTTNTPSYKLMDKNWLELNQLGKQSLKPTFGDLDGDGDQDLILGCNDGTLIYKENIAEPNQPMSFGTSQLNYQGIDVGNFSTPQIIDIDGDSLLDLVIGKKNGFISYYHNTGNDTNAIFTLVTDTMGHIRTSSYWHYYNGYSVPDFYYDENDSLRAFVGSGSGFCFYYRDIRNNITGNFGIDTNLSYTDEFDTLVSVMNFINEENTLEVSSTNFKSAPLIYDFDNDGFLDIMVGTFSGGINYFKGITRPFVGIPNIGIVQNPKINLYPNPTTDIVNVEVNNGQNYNYAIVSVYDISGRMIFQQQNNNANIIKVNTSKLVKGIYIIKIQLISNKTKFSKNMKIIKY